MQGKRGQKRFALRAKAVVLASDHAGFALKEALKGFLAGKGFSVEDRGPKIYDKDDDYPDFVIPAAQRVASLGAKGIFIGKTGQGEAFAANKVKGVRAVVYYCNNHQIIKFSREHNDANVLSIGGEFVTGSDAKRAALLWLTSGFTKAERHVRRLRKIARYESRH